ncbi:MAG TPA: PRC-barrel domain-containing protein [Noviherbaspirillum sp.]|nr:PRC-barrel domain-containing protein [Noviherbaspirillum sp.]
MFLHSVKGLDNFTVAAKDGDVGTVDDVYFDEEKWVIRYLVVDTGDWFIRRDVLISPISIRRNDWALRTMHADLTRQQIRDSPSIDTAQPVSRRHEAELHRHYGYSYYWTGPYMWGEGVYPGILEERPFDEPGAGTDTVEHGESAKSAQSAAGHNADEHVPDNRHLFSCKDVMSYAIRTPDESFGHVEDLLFDDDDWSVQFLVIDPRNWWPGKPVLVSPSLIDHISSEDRSVVMGITRDELEHCPAYDSRNPPPSKPHRPRMHP